MGFELCLQSKVPSRVLLGLCVHATNQEATLPETWSLCQSSEKYGFPHFVPSLGLLSSHGHLHPPVLSSC